jgi:D-arabinose 1-dehydrogenase-like Zn-dependent alcohol dehydrogenase
MGTRSDFEGMNRYLEQNKIHFDVLLKDDPFTFDKAQDAYDRLESGKFYGKVIIKIE